jgi:hypothetical protein
MIEIDLVGASDDSSSNPIDDEEGKDLRFILILNIIN